MIEFGQTKFCNSCQRNLSIADFYPRRNRNGGIQNSCKKCQLIKNRLRYQRNKERYGIGRLHDSFYRKNWDLKKYGINFWEYTNLVLYQNGLCAICENEPNDGKLLHVDHSHETGKIRGLLCFNCNTLLGKARDNPKVLMKALKYLEEFSS